MLQDQDQLDAPAAQDADMYEYVREDEKSDAVAAGAATDEQRAQQVMPLPLLYCYKMYATCPCFTATKCVLVLLYVCPCLYVCVSSYYCVYVS